MMKRSESGNLSREDSVVEGGTDVKGGAPAELTPDTILPQISEPADRIFESSELFVQKKPGNPSSKTGETVLTISGSEGSWQFESEPIKYVYFKNKRDQPVKFLFF